MKNSLPREATEIQPWIPRLLVDIQGIGSNFNVYILKAISILTATFLLLSFFRTGICYSIQFGGTKKYLSCFKIYAIACCFSLYSPSLHCFQCSFGAAPRVSNCSLQFFPGSKRLSNLNLPSKNFCSLVLFYHSAWLRIGLRNIHL